MRWSVSFQRPTTVCPNQDALTAQRCLDPVETSSTLYIKHLNVIIFAKILNKFVLNQEIVWKNIALNQHNTES
jgi:hypothetical protein